MAPKLIFPDEIINTKYLPAMKKINQPRIYTCVSGDMYLEKPGEKDRQTIKLLMIRFHRKLSV
jgi:hypothetical protein